MTYLWDNDSFAFPDHSEWSIPPGDVLEKPMGAGESKSQHKWTFSDVRRFDAVAPS